MAQKTESFSIGVMASDHVAVGVVQDHKVRGSVHSIPDLGTIPPDSLAPVVREKIEVVCLEAGVDPAAIAAIGFGFPGIVREGTVQDSPNIKQAKGLNLAQAMAATFSGTNSKIPVLVLNDADAMAAGVAATRGALEKLVRVWTLGNGIGFGRYPEAEGAWECGHIVVTLDPKEHYCGCGGLGHLEGIMGYRAMRMRFLDMEPEEVFENAKEGDAKCLAFTKLWHRALAAATANLVHQDAPGKFYITGPNSVYIEIPLLNQYLHEMVKMTPLQGSVFEVIPTSDEIAVIGAAVSAGIHNAVN
jgi:predicted NBD/HSP70 family sugar kinase